MIRKPNNHERLVRQRLVRVMRDVNQDAGFRAGMAHAEDLETLEQQAAWIERGYLLADEVDAHDDN